MQVISNADNLVLSYSLRYPGSTHDAFIYVETRPLREDSRIDILIMLFYKASIFIHYSMIKNITILNYIFIIVYFYMIRKWQPMEDVKGMRGIELGKR